MPDNIFCFFSSVKSPLALTKYSLSIIDEGCMHRFAKVPSFVNNIRPEELISNLPIEIHLIFEEVLGKKSKTRGISFSFLFEESTPSGLLSINSLISDSLY